MGNSSPQQSEASVPGAAQPILGQAQSMVPQFTGMTLNPATYTMSPLQSATQTAGTNLFSPNGAYTQGTNTLSNILSPGFSNPANNPNLASMLGLAQSQFTRGLGSSLDMLGSSFGMAGQTPSNSGAFLNAGNNLTRNALNDYNLNIGNILGNQYNTGVSQQLQGLQALMMQPQLLGGLSSLGSLPQQLATTQQQGQIDLSQIPFGMLMQILGGMPLSYPSYAPHGNGGMGALTGAGSGAMAGSAFGPWGTGIGAGIGAIGGYAAGR